MALQKKQKNETNRSVVVKCWDRGFNYKGDRTALYPDCDVWN